MTVHAHSRAAYATIGLATCRKIVLDCFAGGALLTDRDVAEQVGAEIYTIRPRITELLAAGRLAEAGSGRDRVTGRKVRICVAL